MKRGRHTFRLRFDEREITKWAGRFPDGSDDDLLGRIRPLVLVRGHLTRPEFLEICAWKSVRTKPRCRKNSAHRIETLTRAALATSDEALKIDLRRLLDGVEWPTASTILHFCDAPALPDPRLSGALVAGLRQAAQVHEGVAARP